jgi:hypothetical protein
MIININAATSIRDIRDIAVALGVDPQGKSRDELVSALLAKDRELENLRLECARQGLSPDGSESELRIRLAAADPDTISAADRRLYAITGAAFLFLGIAALGVSIPHLTGELARLTGLSFFMALALAVVIDGAVCACKLAEVLGRKFETRSIAAMTRGLMLAALLFSGAVNASGFIEGGAGGVVAALVGVAFAGMIAGTTFASFQAAAFLLTVREKRRPEQPAPAAAAPDPVAKMKKATEELAALIDAARGLK